MATPTVTITVGGVPITATTTSIPTADPDTALDQALYMMYVQAVKGDTRYQWIVFPPAVEALGVTKSNIPGDTGTLYMLARVQRHEGNRSKWFHHKSISVKDEVSSLTQTLRKHEEGGYAVSGLVVVPLEADDYLALWNSGDTPQKAIRAVDRALKPFGLTTK